MALEPVGSGQVVDVEVAGELAGQVKREIHIGLEEAWVPNQEITLTGSDWSLTGGDFRDFKKILAGPGAKVGGPNGELHAPP